MVSNSKYRPDIDGMRAVAVIGVLLFHAKFAWIPGGFVGVDVFFVISGFLITRMIVDHEGSMPSFLGSFYTRRIRRLVPPAIPVLIFTAAYGWLLFPPAAFEEFGQSLIAYSTFASNWFFQAHVGYFDGPSQLKPLLHTWSLSIEEQFYLLFPIPILLLKRYRPNAVTSMLAAVFLLSLAYSIYLIWTGEADSGFYNSLSRFWEIALGSLLAVGAIKTPKTALVRASAGAIGLSAIVVSMLTFGEAVPFPGYAALLPTVGAVLVILSSGSAVNRFLSWRPIVAIGLISYALYLWHWPIFVFIEYAIPGAGEWNFALGIAVSLILAAVSYFVLERPVRRQVVIPSPKWLAAAFATTLIVQIGGGAWIWHTGGAPDRFPLGQAYTTALLPTLYNTAEERLRSQCWLATNEPLQPALQRCVHTDEKKQNLLLIGDSHAAQFYPALVRDMPNTQISLIATDGCTLVRGKYPTCNDLTDWVEQLSGSNPIPFDRIVISARVDKQGAAEAIAALAKRLAGAGTSVTVFGPIQYYRPSLTTLFPTMVDRASTEQLQRAFDDAVQTEQFAIDSWFTDAFRNTAVQYVSLLRITCPQGPLSCQHLDTKGVPVTLDDTHLTMPAAQKIIDAVVRRLSP